ncbi:hypothetical protein [Carboxylicivirga sp. N1Y90]|uniref:hypothetical protein n=1 Tax=Carboxylicivirga fragile TaxID=3417571 RepID=UPI003D3384DB|nr:hypothetical protein [Marinilabiliaceae bacterium N1Y90]
MKYSVLFKSLIDIFCFGLLVVLSALFISELVELYDNDKIDISLSFESIFNLIITVLSMAYWITFLRGIMFLRRVARNYLSRDFISPKIVANLKMCGKHFLYAGGISAFILFIVQLAEDGFLINPLLLIEGFVVSPLFLFIIGLFFLIQCGSLFKAIILEEENSLTV